MRYKTVLIFAFLFFHYACTAQIINLHTFNDTLGAYPYGNLTYINNKLYGLASQGGSGGGGVVFTIDTNGNAYKVIYNFQDSIGWRPEESVGWETGSAKIFGTTTMGGMGGYGTLFSVDTNGSNYKTIYSFGGFQGASPSCTPIVIGNKLFGTTTVGGTSDYGVLFSVDTNGNNYKILCDFNNVNGIWPGPSVIAIKSKLYGVTAYGGVLDSGVIFTIDTDGNNYKILYSFNLSSGKVAISSLVSNGNKLYGLTTTGGSFNAGTVFSIDTNGTNFHILHAFNDTDGADAHGSLLLVQKKLYGTASGGGSTYLGTIFSLDTDGGHFSLLATFNEIDGASPYGALNMVGNKCYGMTWQGVSGYGNIFSFDTTITVINVIRPTNSHITIFPNPSTGTFTVHLSNTEQGISNVEVFDVLGQRVYSLFNIQGSIFDIHLISQPSGVYFYRVLEKDGSLVGEGKVIVEK